MNVEINLLEQKPKKSLTPFLIGILAFLMIASVAGWTGYQMYALKHSITAKETEIEELEALMSVHQEAAAYNQKLLQLQESLHSLQQESLPAVPLYHDVLNLFDKKNQLLMFENISSSQFIVEGSFISLAEVEEYVSRLLEQSYTVDVSLAGIDKDATGYIATLAVYFDESVVKKELIENE
jgi:Tfp pilus assembly protein PilN